MTVSSDEVSRVVCLGRDTTAKSLRETLGAVFGIAPIGRSRMVLSDPESGAVVPMDRSVTAFSRLELTLGPVPPRDDNDMEDDDRADEEQGLHHRLLVVSETINADLDWVEALQAIAESTARVVDAAESAIYLVDQESGARLVRVAALPVPAEVQQTSQRSLVVESMPLDSTTLVGEAAVSREMVQEADDTAIAVPVFDRNSLVIAVLLVVARDGTRFSFDDRRALVFTATQAGGVLHRLQLCALSEGAVKRQEAAVERQKRILKVTKALAAAGRLQDVIGLIKAIAHDELRAERVSVFLVHHDTQELEIALSADAKGVRIPMSKGVAGDVARSGKPVNIVDAQADERFDASTDSQTGFRTRSVLCCPIIDAAGRVVGVVQALNKTFGGRRSTVSSTTPRVVTKRVSDFDGEDRVDDETNEDDDVFDGSGTAAAMIDVPDEATSEGLLSTLSGASAALSSHSLLAFDEDDQEMLQMLCTFAGVTMAKAEQLEDAKRAATLNRSLLDVVRAVVQETDFSKTLLVILRSLASILDADRVALLLVDEAEAEFTVCRLNEAGVGVETSLRLGLRPDKSVEGKVARSGRLINVRDVSRDEDFSRELDLKTRYVTHHMICAPLNLGARVEGGARHVVIALNKHESEYSLARAAKQQDATVPQARGFVAFSDRDETTLKAWTDEIEHATRFKKIEVEVKHLLLNSSSVRRDPSESVLASMYKTKARVERAASPRASDVSIASVVTSPAPRPLVSAVAAMTTTPPTPPPAAMRSSSAPPLPSTSSSSVTLAAAVGSVTDRTVAPVASRPELRREPSDQFSDSRLATRAAETLRKLDWRVVDFLAQKKDTLREWTEAVLYSDLTLLRRCKVNTAKLASFVQAVCDNYRETNAFHNFAHAFAVMHTAWCMLNTEVSGRLLESTERLAVLLAALCHDLGHPGNTNSLELNVLSSLAITYSDDAVLEKHHCYLTLQLLYRDASCNILGDLKPDSPELQDIRKTIVHCIMSTDMRHHVEHVAELERRVDSRRTKSSQAARDDMSIERGLKTPPRSRRASLLTAGFNVDPAASVAASSAATTSMSASSVVSHRRSTSSSGAYVFDPPRPFVRGGLDAESQFASESPAVDAFDPEDDAGILLLCGSIVHAADLSSQTLPFDLATPWGRAISREFLAQADVERSLGLKESVPIWRDDRSFYAGQSFFCRQLVLPLWKAVGGFMPEIAPRIANIEANRRRYDEIVTGLARAADAAAQSSA